jgi:hypothetical protein
VSEARLFMVGCARTGSTLLRHILNRSNHVSIASETHFMNWAARERLERRLGSVRDASGDRAAAALDELVGRFYLPGAWQWVGRNVSPETLRQRLASTDLSEGATLGLLMDLYAEQQAKPPDGLVIGEKTPSHLYHVERLIEWFPEARIVHTFRDPRAIYHSELRRRRDGRWGPKARLGWLPVRLVDPLLAPLQAAHTTRRWLDAVHFHDAYAVALGDRYRLVRFEDLVSQPEDQVRQICDFLAIPFEPAMLDGVRVVGSSFERQRKGTAGIAPHAANRWVDAIHPLAAAWFARALGGRLRDFGYAT